jgi:hypothetical protein
MLVRCVIYVSCVFVLPTRSEKSCRNLYYRRQCKLTLYDSNFQLPENTSAYSAGRRKLLHVKVKYGLG